MRNPAKEWKSRGDMLREINIPQMEDRLTSIRERLHDNAMRQSLIEDLLIMIVTHLKGEEIR